MAAIYIMSLLGRYVSVEALVERSQPLPVALCGGFDDVVVTCAGDDPKCFRLRRGGKKGLAKAQGYDLVAIPLNEELGRVFELKQAVAAYDFIQVQIAECDQR